MVMFNEVLHLLCTVIPLLKFNLLYVFQHQQYHLVINADILQRGLPLRADSQKCQAGCNIASFSNATLSFRLQVKGSTLPDSLASTTQLEVQFSSLVHVLMTIRIYGDRADLEPAWLQPRSHLWVSRGLALLPGGGCPAPLPHPYPCLPCCTRMKAEEEND